MDQASNRDPQFSQPMAWSGFDAGLLLCNGLTPAAACVFLDG